MVTRRIIRFLPKSQDFDWKRRNPRQLKVKAQPTRHIVGGFQKRCPTTTRRRNGQGRAAKRFVHFDRDEKAPRHPLVPRGDGEDGDLPIAGKSPESLKETPDFEVVRPAAVMMAGGAAPHRQVPAGPRLLLRGASKLPDIRFAPLRKTLDGAGRRAPGGRGGLLHGRKKSGAPEGNSGL